MRLTDTHTHLYYETDATLQQQLMNNCFANGVNRLFLPNVNVETIALIDNMVAQYPENCFAMLGLHPCEVKEDFESQLQEIYNSIATRKIYAIGEIGIDLYWDRHTLNHQITAFETQIKWAKALNLPIVIHCRDAFDEVLAVLEQQQDGNLRGILHCFTGDLAQAERLIHLGFYLGIGGVVTYKKSALGDVLLNVPLQHIVLETDSPYLSPVPFRGKPNQSSYLIYVAQKIADIYKMSVDEIAQITTDNSRKIFNI